MATEKLVVKPNGQVYRVIYGGPGRITWVPVEAPARQPGPHPQDMASSPMPTLPIGFGPLTAITAVAETAADLATAWESRQQRLFLEANAEESKRMGWLADMIGRWAEVHEGGGQLDLRVSEYLAREARHTMDAMVANKRLSLPQSMLYELAAVQDGLRSFRGLLLDQFEEFTASNQDALHSVFELVLPHRRLNMDHIRWLAQDPALDWNQHVKDKNTKDFGSDLNRQLRDQNAFLTKLFPSAELAIPEPVERTAPSGLLTRLVSLVNDALPRFEIDTQRPEATERRDEYQELELLPAEVARVKALHSAWLATNRLVLEATGTEPEILVGPRRLQVSIPSAQDQLALGKVGQTAALETPALR